MTDRTPGRLSKGCSIHQKQPPAKIALSTGAAVAVVLCKQPMTIRQRRMLRQMVFHTTGLLYI
jgi:hypothetical protein